MNRTLSAVFPGLAHKIVQVGHMVAGFVAVSILPNQAGDVVGSLFAHIAFYLKKRIQLFGKPLFAAQQLNKALYIVRRQPGILLGIALRKVILHVTGFK